MIFTLLYYYYFGYNIIYYYSSEYFIFIKKITFSIVLIFVFLFNMKNYTDIVILPSPSLFVKPVRLDAKLRVYLLFILFGLRY